MTIWVKYGNLLLQILLIYTGKLHKCIRDKMLPFLFYKSTFSAAGKFEKPILLLNIEYPISLIYYPHNKLALKKKQQRIAVARSLEMAVI